jgi:tetratricopeptide (TPR) repeat protein
MSRKEEALQCCKRGWALLKRNEPEEAAKEFQRATVLADDLLEAHEGLGLSCFRHLENFEAIMDRLGRPGAFSPDDIAKATPPPGTVTIDGVPIEGTKFLKLVEVGNRALMELTRAFEMGTARVEVYEALARTPGVDGFVRRKCLDHVLRRNPESAWSNYCRGMDHVHNEDYKEAAEFLARACSARPDDAEWRSELGNALLHLGDVGGALEHLALAVRLNPGFASAWYNLGTACLRGNRRDMAMTAYRKFLEIEPYSMDAKQLKQLFPELSGSPPPNEV